MSEPCTLVDAWLYQAADIADDGLPPDEVVAHVSGCPRCRVALIALLADRIGSTIAIQDQACPDVEADLPAFVDLERSQGLVAAAHAFPDVWWHSLVCSDCDELYRALHELTAEPPAVATQPVEAQLWPARFGIELELHPAMIRQLLSSHHLGAEWGVEAEDMLLSEESNEAGLIQVSLRQDPPDHLALVVRTHPPAQGVVVLTLGAARYDQPLDLQGCAIFSGLAMALFATNSGPVKLLFSPLTP